MDAQGQGMNMAALRGRISGGSAASLLADGARSLAALVRRVWLLILLAVLWEILARGGQSLFIPPLSDILVQFAKDWLPFGPTGVRNLVHNALPTFQHMTGGWLLAAASGIGIGLCLGRMRALEMFVRPLLRFGMNVPPPALLPLTIVLFGFNAGGMLFLIGFGAVWPILINTLDAAREIDQQLVATGRVLHFSRWQFVTRVLIPACAPRIMTGMRVGLSLALILTVIAEMYGATSGIGRAIVSAQRSFQTLEMWSGIVMLALLGVAANRVFLLVELRLLRWHSGWRAMER
jgi:ABC-type nitrate/sulfonate/bicarbonate transport system permease component